MANIGKLLREHITLEVECVDRMYLNGYVARLQTPGQLVDFLRRHRGHAIPSPVLLGEMTKDFVKRVEAYARENSIPIVQFERDERKDDVAESYRQRWGDREGVVFIGVAQEKAYAYRATKAQEQGHIRFDYSRQWVYVKHYYFYLQDHEFGPCFIKVCTYAPFPIKVYVNGHEWAKQQARKAGIRFEALDNGFLSCADAERLQQVCRCFGAKHIQAFFDKWIKMLPMPLVARDRTAGYRHRLSIWQLEVSLTHVFQRPVQGRQFFEELIRENIDLGRPDRMQLVFDRRITKRTPGIFRTRVIQQGVQPSLHIEYKRCRVKQYFKENRALRTETTINDPSDFHIQKDLRHFEHLRKIGQQINRRLLDVQRVSHNCTLSPSSLDRVVHPSRTEAGQRAPALRFGDRRVMALTSALNLFMHCPAGFTNRALRTQVADLLGPDHSYGRTQMTYDLRRLRLKGIIYRPAGTASYWLTPYGQKLTLFFCRLYARVFQPAFAAIDAADSLPRPLTRALNQVNKELDAIINASQLAKAA